MTKREAIRAELEETRKNFHQLLDSLSNEDLRRKSINARWTIGELLVHVIYWLDYTPRIVEMLRKGTGIRNVPVLLFDLANIWLTRFAARKVTVRSIGLRYDEAHDVTLRALDGVRDDEWGKSATFIKGEVSTMESIFHSIRSHFEEHAVQIRESLGHD